jgi:hypothetical protein
MARGLPLLKIGSRRLRALRPSDYAKSDNSGASGWTGPAWLRSILLLRHHSRGRRYGGDRRHGRDREGQPRIPSRRPVGGIEFAISLQIEISLHVSDRKQKSDLWTDTDELISWTARLTGNVPGEARCSVCEGHSPNILRYSTEKRPNSTKPKQVAISVTVTSLQSAHKRARLACDNRNIRRCRHGATPLDLWKALRSVRSLTSRVRHKTEMCSGASICARANLSACSTRSLCVLLSRLKGVSATISSH